MGKSIKIEVSPREFELMFQSHILSKETCIDENGNVVLNPFLNESVK